MKRAREADACRVIAINDTYRAAPWADVLYACDGPWWDRAHGARDFAGQRWTQDRSAAERWGLNWVEGRYRPGLSDTPKMIHYGGNSGYQAINLAYHFAGGPLAILIAYDMQKAPDGRRHHHDTEPAKSFPDFRAWVANFATMRPDLDRLGLDVVNCSRVTAIPESTFRRADLGAALCGLS